MKKKQQQTKNIELFQIGVGCSMNLLFQGNRNLNLSFDKKALVFALEEKWCRALICQHFFLFYFLLLFEFQIQERKTTRQCLFEKIYYIKRKLNKSKTNKSNKKDSQFDIDQWQSLFDIQKVLQKLFIARKSTVVYGNSNQPSQGDTCRR